MRNKFKNEAAGDYSLITGVIRREFLRQGYVFKSPSIYVNEPDRICYIGEFSDHGYTANDFLSLANGDKNFADTVFAAVDWQSPATYIDELLKEGDAGHCSFCGEILSSSRTCSCQRDPFSGDILPKDMPKRQYEIIRDVANGLTNLDIAHRLGLAENTVKNHVQIILKKMGFNNRTELAKYYFTNIWRGRDKY